jgi:hypothetical protein
MPVIQVSGGLDVEPDHIYVISPGTLLTLAGGWP